MHFPSASTGVAHRSSPTTLGALTLLVLGCTGRSASDDPTAADSSSGRPSDSSDASDPQTTNDLPDTSSSTSADSSSGEPIPECGNGILEAGEACDGEPGCVDCLLTCGFAPPVDMSLTGVSWTTSSTPPLALDDGTGDLIVTSGAGIHRVTADGEELWVESEPDSSVLLRALTSTDPDHVWVAWTFFGANSVARYTRNSVADGSEVDAFEVAGAPDSEAGDLLATAGGSLFAVTSVAVDEMQWRARVELRSAAGTDVDWTTELMVEPQPDGYAEVFGSGVVEAEGGALFVNGVQRVDFDTKAPVLAKLESDGSLLWQRTVGPGALYSRAWHPVSMPDGGVALIVQQQFSNAGTIGNTPGFFTTVLRLDADGESLWEIDPTDDVADGRVQVATIRALGDRFVVAGALVDERGGAAPWLGYLDAKGELLCSTTAAHPGGDPSAIDYLFTAADGGLMVQGFSDDDEPGSAATGRWIAAVYPY